MQSPAGSATDTTQFIEHEQRQPPEPAVIPALVAWHRLGDAADAPDQPAPVRGFVEPGERYPLPSTDLGVRLDLGPARPAINERRYHHRPATAMIERELVGEAANAERAINRHADFFRGLPTGRARSAGFIDGFDTPARERHVAGPRIARPMGTFDHEHFRALARIAQQGGNRGALEPPTQRIASCSMALEAGDEWGEFVHDRRGYGRSSAAALP